jgi:hypothetical protein
MVAPANRKAGGSEALGRQMDFYTVRSLLDFLPGLAGSEAQERLNAMIEAISTRAQPVIVTVDPVDAETDPVDLPDASGEVNVYTMKFAVEHQNAWEGATPSLKDTLIGVHGFTAGNLSVIFHDGI